LSFADFTGAVLVEASFAGAKLHRTRFGCAAKLRLKIDGRSSRTDSCDDERAADLRGADFTEAALHGVFLNRAKLHGARFSRVMMQGGAADDADLSGASFSLARLEGSSFVGATLAGASFSGAQMQGADLRDADLSNSTLFRTQLQGARLHGAKLTNATLHRANLYRSFVKIADHRDTMFLMVQAGPTFPRLQGASARNEQDGRLVPKTLDPGGYKVLVSRAQAQIRIDDVPQIVATRLLPLDPAKKAEEDQLLADKPIKSERDVYDRVRGRRADALAKLMCEADGAPYVARGFIYSGRIIGMASASATAAADPALRAIEQLRGTECPGAVGLDVNDLRQLASVERQVHARRRQRHADDPALTDAGGKPSTK
jgi:uncharacterized protein YjbI with pentapeptide repeats